MSFTLEQYDEYYSNLQNGYKIVEIAPKNGVRRFEVVEIEPYVPTNEEQRRCREIAYSEEVDCITSHIQRLRDMEQTQEIIDEINSLITERDEKVREIQRRYPYSGE